MLDREDFLHLVRIAPLVSIDLILRDERGFVLVGLRNNEPARGFWFVPGGIIRKNETREAAFGRILAAETGLDIPFAQARLMGAYDHIYRENSFGEPGFGTHYVVLGYAVDFSVRPDVRTDSQHSRYRWMSEDEILSSTQVHDNTKAYCGR